MNRLEVKIKSKVFDNHLIVLKDLKFTANAGEFIALVGPSGAGKTTLLNMIAGIDKDFDGEVNNQTNHPGKVASLRIGFMFQQPSLMPWLTVLGNLRLVLQPSHLDNSKSCENFTQQERALELINQIGLSGFEHSFPNQLSGGMQKRLSMARAFAVDPEILLLDEPFQSLDSPTADKFRKQLLALWSEKKQTVLFVTHDLREAISLADRVLFLSDRPANILLDYQIELDRSRERTDYEINQLAQNLLEKYPELLSGKLD